MTKRDYVMLARILSEAQPLDKDSQAVIEAVRGTVSFIASELAYELQRDNARFDRARFLNACGVVP